MNDDRAGSVVADEAADCRAVTRDGIVGMGVAHSARIDPDDPTDGRTATRCHQRDCRGVVTDDTAACVFASDAPYVAACCRNSARRGDVVDNGIDDRIVRAEKTADVRTATHRSTRARVGNGMGTTVVPEVARAARDVQPDEAAHVVLTADIAGRGRVRDVGGPIAEVDAEQAAGKLGILSAAAGRSHVACGGRVGSDTVVRACQPSNVRATENRAGCGDVRDVVVECASKTAHIVHAMDRAGRVRICDGAGRFANEAADVTVGRRGNVACRVGIGDGRCIPACQAAHVPTHAADVAGRPGIVHGRRVDVAEQTSHIA